jgi:hypothetical protein
MVSQHSVSVAERAKSVYEERLRENLESKHPHKFVAIEPDSGDFFIGSTYGQSVMAAREAHPDRISFVIRIGHEAAIHLGAITNRMAMWMISYEHCLTSK